MKLSKLQKSDKKSRKIRAESLGRYKKIDGVLHHQELPFVPKVIQTKLISRYYDNSLAGHFGINKTRELIGRNWSNLRKDVKSYIKCCNVCLSSKTVKHKPNGIFNCCLCQPINEKIS